METWKVIKNFDLYEISTLGRIRRVGREKIVGSCIAEGGYESVALLKESGRWINRRVHLIMVETFIDDSQSYKNRIVHIDGDRTNNRLDNLRLKFKGEKIAHSSSVDIKSIKYLVNKIDTRGWIDAIDMLRVASLHVDLYGDIYSGEPQDQIPHMYEDLKQYIKVGKK